MKGQEKRCYENGNGCGKVKLIVDEKVLEKNIVPYAPAGKDVKVMAIIE